MWGFSLAHFLFRILSKGGYERLCSWGPASVYASEAVLMRYLAAYFWKVEQSDANVDFV